MAIARALLANPRLLLFNETTSHLDTESERITQNNLKTILKGRTSVIVAHRLSTVHNADLILVGGEGNDKFIFHRIHTFFGNNFDIIQDFQVCEDQIIFKGWGNIDTE